MIGKLISDYIMTGRSTSLKEAPQGIGDVALFPLILPLFIIVRGILKPDAEYLWTDVLRDSIFILPLFFIWISQIKHPLRMSRMYYLCPMTKEERAAYLKNAYLFRGAFHSLLILVMCIALYFTGKVSIFALLYILLDGIMFSFLSNVHDSKKDFVRNVFLKPAMLTSAYIQYALPVSAFAADDFIFTVCSFAFLLLVELPLFLSILHAVNKDIQCAALSEEDYSRC